MKTKIITLFGLLIVVFSMSSQSIDRQLFTTSGNADDTLIFTLGEPIVGPIQNTSIIYQGFLATADIGSLLSTTTKSSNSSIKVFPNPTTEYLNIHFNNISENPQVFIYNTLGQLVQSEKINNESISINIGQLSKGWYLVNILFLETKNSESFKILKN